MTTLEEKLERYYSNFPSLYKPGNNIEIDAFFKAWAKSDAEIENAIPAARDQLFVKRAIGLYLDRLASNCNIVRPTSLYLNDDIFRQIIPILCHGNPATKSGLSALIDILFGEEAQRANCTSQNPETYRVVKVQDFSGNGTNLGTFQVGSVTDLAIGYEIEIEDDVNDRISVYVTDITGTGPYTIEVDGGLTDLSAYTVAQNAQFRTGETLRVQTDRGIQSIRFPSSAFADTDAATVDEIIAYYNAHMSWSKASKFINGSNVFLRIRTTTIGAGGYVLITGGTLNNLLNFDTRVRCQNAQVIIVEPGDENTVIIETPTDTTIVSRTLRGSLHLRENEDIIDGRPDVNSSAPFYPGPFLASPATNGFIRSTTCTLQEVINVGDYKGSIQVDDASDFPDAVGDLTMGFGTASEEGPFKYFSRSSNTQIDFSPPRFFSKSHDIGEIINLSTAIVTDTEDYGIGFNGYKPRDDGSDYMAFVTDPLTTPLVLGDILSGLTDAGIPIAILSESHVYRWSEL